MSTGQDNSPFLSVGNLLEKVSKVKLRGGVVGKLSLVMMVTAIAMSVIAWSAGHVWVAGALGVLLFVLIMTLGCKLISFADRNPHAALLEGAELLLHEQMTVGMKGGPSIAVAKDDLSTDPDSPPLSIPPPDYDESEESGDTDDTERGEE